jgi:hypothetical protein
MQVNELSECYSNVKAAPNRSTISLEKDSKRPQFEQDASTLTHDHIVSILACRKKRDKVAKKFINGIKQGMRNKDLRRHFNLDSKEEIIEKFSCPNEGHLYHVIDFCQFILRDILQLTLCVLNLYVATTEFKLLLPR